MWEKIVAVELVDSSRAELRLRDGAERERRVLAKNLNGVNV
jgi:hypothetical protein